MNKIRQSSGFTLMELLVVLMILGVLAAIGLPIYSNTIEKMRAGEAIDAITAVKGAEIRYSQEHPTSEFWTGPGGPPGSSNYTPGPNEIDVGWQLKYWDICIIDPDGGAPEECRIVATRIDGAAAGDTIGLDLVDGDPLDALGSWDGSHIGTPNI